VKPLLLIVLLTSAISAEAQWYEGHPLPWDRTETYASIGEAVGVGAVVPTGSYLIWNRLSPTHRPQKRLMRIAVCHLATAGLAVATMRGPAPTDGDPRYGNILLMIGASMTINNIIDGLRVGWWQKKIWQGIKRNTAKQSPQPSDTCLYRHSKCDVYQSP